MSVGTRRGEPAMRPGERIVLPPPIPPRITRCNQPIDRPLGHLYASTAIAVMATLDIEAVYQHLRDDLPPSVQAAVTALGDPEWTTVYRQAIRTQDRLLQETSSHNRDLRRHEPLLLADFLPAMRP